LYFSVKALADSVAKSSNSCPANAFNEDSDKLWYFAEYDLSDDTYTIDISYSDNFKLSLFVL